MGILPILFESVEKSFIHSLNDIENDLQKIQSKIDSKLISIISTGGKYEGTSLISSLNDETIIKKLSEKIMTHLAKIDDF